MFGTILHGRNSISDIHNSFVWMCRTRVRIEGMNNHARVRINASQTNMKPTLKPTL